MIPCLPSVDFSIWIRLGVMKSKGMAVQDDMIKVCGIAVQDGMITFVVQEGMIIAYSDFYM